MSKTLLVDGNNLIMRAFYAMRGSTLSANGVPTATLSTFISLLSRYVRQVSPDNLVVCWDDGKSSYRQAIDGDYKGNRLSASEDHSLHFRQAKEFLTLAGVHHTSQPGVEADDIIAAYWRSAHSGEHVTILSSDKDFLQLIDGKTTQIRPGTGVNEIWTTDRVAQEFGGCPPHAIPAIMALTGDSSDNVIGIPGFGVKTAVKFLEPRGWSLDALLADETVTKLDGQRDRARVNLSLVDLRSPRAGIEAEGAPRFFPTNPASIAYPPLIEFLDQYQLARVHEMLIDGRLWQDAPSLDRTLNTPKEK